MTTTATSQPTSGGGTTKSRKPWVRLLVGSVLISTTVDIAVMVLTGVVIPPVALGAVLSLVGLALLGRFPRGAVAALATISVLLVVTGAPFVVPLLAHPDAALDFFHAAVHLGGRLVAIIAAVGVWRHASAEAALWPARLAVAGLSAALVVAAVGVARTPDEAPVAGDVPVAIADFAFPTEVHVRSGGTIFAQNTDLVGHTFSVQGTDLSHQLPGRANLRFPVELEPGTYRLFCAVAGHEAMRATLVVE